jgi:hypothetical protein
MPNIRNILLVAALAVTGGFLAACDSNSTPREPPPPPQVYIVKHMTADGSTIATYRSYNAFGDGGCVKFEAIGDPPSMKYRVVCGNVSVNPEEK